MRRIAIFAAALLVPVFASGQSLRPLQPPDAERLRAVKAATTPSPPGAETQASATTATPPADSPRLQKLRQLQFDRRPSSILKAWSTPPRPAATSDEPREQTEPKAEPKSTVEETNADAQKAAAEAAAKAKKDAEAAKLLDAELAVFQRHVTLGDWPEVKSYFAGITKEEAKAGYKQLLVSLNAGAAQRTPQIQAIMQSSPQLAAFVEKNTFNPEDVFGLAAAAPHEVDKDLLLQLGGILRQTLERGVVIEEFVVRMKAEIAKPDGAAITRRQAAQLLFGANQQIAAGEFLPESEQAKSDNDREALNLLARFFLARHAKDKKSADLEQAWTVTQASLALTAAVDEKDETKRQAAEAEKDESLRRAVELAPKVREEFGQKWLEESFTHQPERGMEIIATIGSQASKGFETHAADPTFRLKGIELQKTAVEALVAAAPDKVTAWRASLNLLAANWLKEAEFSYRFAQSSSLGARLRRDPFGNIFYVDEEYYARFQRQPGQGQPIATGEIIAARPGDQWLAMIDESMKPKFQSVFAQLYLKVNEEAKAFPYIEQLAQTHPDKARELAEEFLGIWTTNHNPNANRGQTNHYMFMYGFERRAEGIPLTRSKQERNLDELADLVRRLRSLPIGELKEVLLAKAFTTCHSSAEVYRLEAIERVFGDLGGLKPKTLAALVQQMRENLIGVWRQPAQQEDKKTKRKQKDIETEVLRGYSVARSVVDRTREEYPDEWSLQQVHAAILHDENNYRHELAKSTDFSKKRDAAFAEFRRAAELYAVRVGEIPEEEESTSAYEQWFYASLGACDLQHIDQEKQPDLRQPKLIREAIESLGGEAAQRHMAKFANSLFTRMSALSPAVKFRYLREGFEIVGNHKQAVEARKVFDYYKDLVTEIKLEAAIDGSDVVGHGQPFGVFVNLKHTREIERESGGFGRYLQNQNNMRFSYNYGRPTENYRDKFQETAKQALDEHFEVLSVTFQDEKVNSKAVQEYGWRVTPYAYVLLKARSPQVDKIPSMRLDLDFLDTSGYVILPVETPPVPLDASPADGDPRPIQKLQLTQTLDERQADQGKLILEVKATGLGLVPDLSQIVDLNPAGFDITDTVDQGLSVSRFEPESDQTVVVSERTWLVNMQVKAEMPERPTSFRFGTPKIETAESTLQRYADADLEKVEQEISLEQTYGKTSRVWVWCLVAGVAVLAAAVVVLLRKARVTSPEREFSIEVPEQITPFTVLGLLRHIQFNNGLNDIGKQELASTIRGVEQYFFGSGNGAEEPDLKNIAESWVAKTR